MGVIYFVYPVSVLSLHIGCVYGADNLSAQFLGTGELKIKNVVKSWYPDFALLGKKVTVSCAQEEE